MARMIFGAHDKLLEIISRAISYCCTSCYESTLLILTSYLLNQTQFSLSARLCFEHKFSMTLWSTRRDRRTGDESRILNDEVNPPKHVNFRFYPREIIEAVSHRAGIADFGLEKPPGAAGVIIKAARQLILSCQSRRMIRRNQRCRRGWLQFRHSLVSV